MLKYIRAWSKYRKNQKMKLLRWQTEAAFWRDKYRNLKQWVDEIHNDVHSYEGGDDDWRRNN